MKSEILVAGSSRDFRQVLDHDVPNKANQEVIEWMRSLRSLIFTPSESWSALALAAKVMSLMPKMHYERNKPLEISIHITLSGLKSHQTPLHLRRFLQALADVKPARPLNHIAYQLHWPQRNDYENFTSTHRTAWFRISGLVGFDIVVKVAAEIGSNRPLTTGELAQIKDKFIAIRDRFDRECRYRFATNPFAKLPMELQLKIMSYVVPDRIHFGQARGAQSQRLGIPSRLQAFRFRPHNGFKIDFGLFRIDRKLRQAAVDSVHCNTEIILDSDLQNPAWHQNLRGIDDFLGGALLSRARSIKIHFQLRGDNLVPMNANHGGPNVVIGGIELSASRWKIAHIAKLLQRRFGEAEGEADEYETRQPRALHVLQLSCTRVKGIVMSHYRRVMQFPGMTLRVALGAHKLDLEFQFQYSSFEEFAPWGQARIIMVYKRAVRNSVKAIVQRFASRTGWVIQGDFEDPEVEESDVAE